MKVRKIKIKPYRTRKLASELEGMVDQAHRDRTTRVVAVTIILILLVVLAVVMFNSMEGSYDAEEDEWSHPGVFPLVVALFVAIFGYGGRWRLDRRLAKISFVRHLMREIRDELLPQKRMKLRFDLRLYGESGVIFWRGTSQYGNPKTKLNDKWFGLYATLAEGSRLELRIQAGIKTKSGSIMREKRRLFFMIQPNPNRYDVGRIDMGGLKKALKRSVADFFHNHPEDFHVRSEAESGRIKVKVMQTDAEIRPDEIHRILRALVQYISTYQRTGVYR